jgi:hypothetical protein
MPATQEPIGGLWQGYSSGESGWGNQVNANFLRIGALMNIAVLSRTLTAAPGSPTNGDCYIPATGATGVWATKDNQIAVWRSILSAWEFYVPKSGWLAVISATGTILRFDGTSWVPQPIVGTDHLTGFKMTWLSNTSLSVSSGQCVLPSGDSISAPSTITKSSLSLSASTWYHLYVYLNAGVPDIDVSTTAPASAYIGTARTKTGDTTRRYVGSIKTNSSSQIYNFRHNPMNGAVIYQDKTTSTPFRVINNGVATVETTVSVSAAVPVTSFVAQLSMINVSTNNVAAWFNNDDSTASGPPGNGITGLAANSIGLSTAYIDFPLASDQSFTYWNQVAPSGSAVYVDVIAYYYER